MIQSIEEPVSVGDVVDLSLGDLHPFSERMRFFAPPSAEEINLLAKSMSELGLLNPVLVAFINGEFIIVEGNTRCAAARRLKWTSIPSRILEGVTSETHAIRYAVAANHARNDMNPLDTARAVKKLRGSGAFENLSVLGRAIGMLEGLVSQYSKISEIPEEVVRAALAANPKSIEGAVEGNGPSNSLRFWRALSRLNNKGLSQVQLHLAMTAVVNSWSARRTESEVEKVLPQDGPKKVGRPRKPKPVEVVNGAAFDPAHFIASGAVPNNGK